MATQQDFEDLERAYYRLLERQAPPPARKGGIVDWIVNILFIALVTMAIGIGAQFAGWLPPPRTQVDAQPTTRPQAAQQPAYSPQAAPIVVQQQAPPAAALPAAPAAPAVEVVPTAAVYAAPSPVVEVIPQAMPAVAAGSDIRPAPLPTIAIPTPLTLGSDYWLSEDGKCVRAPRGGKTYEVCQDWKYKPNEIASVGDYIHTGLLPGTEVRP